MYILASHSDCEGRARSLACLGGEFFHLVVDAQQITFQNLLLSLIDVTHRRVEIGRSKRCGEALNLSGTIVEELALLGHLLFERICRTHARHMHTNEKRERERERERLERD
jgi:hypothetical protein